MLAASQRALDGLAAQKDLMVLPLHGDLSPEEQDRAVEPASRRKVILSTNVAESSITDEPGTGCTPTIDCSCDTASPAGASTR